MVAIRNAFLLALAVPALAHGAAVVQQEEQTGNILGSNTPQEEEHRNLWIGLAARAIGGALRGAARNPGKTAGTVAAGEAGYQAGSAARDAVDNDDDDDGGSGGGGGGCTIM